MEVGRTNMIKQTPPDMQKVPGGWLCEAKDSAPLFGCKAASTSTELLVGEDIFLIQNFLAPVSCDAINRLMKTSPGFAPVSIQGLQEVTPETTGSFRCTMWNTYLAKELTRLFNNAHFTKVWKCYPWTSTDWWQGNKQRDKWIYRGASNLLRYMKYFGGGTHFCHYDAGYIPPDNDNYRTLMSFVLYLSTNSTGATRFIEDGQRDVDVWDRNHADWDRGVKPEEVRAKSLPVKGSVLIFPHRAAHDVEMYDGAEGERIIIRGDLFYQAAE